jgi:hypothetical protein
MTNVDMGEALVALAQDRGISVDTLLGALADALESAYKRMPDAHEYAWVTIDRPPSRSGSSPRRSTRTASPMAPRWTSPRTTSGASPP